MTAMQSPAETGELPPCTTYADRMHRFQRQGEPVQLFDELALEVASGTGHPCRCGTALIQSDLTGSGYQLITPLPDDPDSWEWLGIDR